MKVAIYQMNQERARDSPVLVDKGNDIPTANAPVYDEVLNMETDWSDLTEIVGDLAVEGHPLYRGKVPGQGDVFVLEDRAYFYGWEGFFEVGFDQTQAMKPDNLLRVVYVEPNKPAVEAELDPDIKYLQKAVGGLIECVYNGDGTILVCNDEGKLIGMEGNRRLGNGSIIAGPFFIVGDGGEDFRSLTNQETERYLQRFAQPEQISQREVQADMGFVFYSF